jgi:mannose-1-phosphate guanylyltransferase
MTNHNHTWALVLAAGEGSQLHTLTTTADGVAVPKQFCSPYGGPSLLEEATRRASHVAPTELVCSIVAEQHRQWWGHSMRHLPAGNVIVQPESMVTLFPPLLMANVTPVSFSASVQRRFATFVSNAQEGILAGAGKPLRSLTPLGP